MPKTQTEKVLAMMIRDRSPERFWYAWEYIGQVHGLFVGHRAPARISELGIDYPDMIESKKDGKYVIFRFRIENYEQFKEKLPASLRAVVTRELLNIGHITAESFLGEIVDNSTTVVTIPTPKGWKCDRKGCTADYKHSHGTFAGLSPQQDDTSVV